MNVSENAYHWSSSLEVVVDGERLELPDWLSDSLPSIKTYLECLAMKQERVLWTLQVDGLRVDLGDVAVPITCASEIRASTITYAALGERLICAGRAKLKQLQQEFENGVLLVLINELSFAEGLWRQWEPQLQEPLFSLRALRELQLPRFIGVFDQQPLSKYADELSMIACEIEAVFYPEDLEGRPPDVIAFSEIVEFTLVPWLNRLDDCFELVEEYRDK